MLSIDDLRDACGKRKLVFTVARGSSFWGLHDLFGENAVVCIDDSPEFDGVAVRFRTLEGRTGKRISIEPDPAPFLEQVWQTAAGAFDGEGWTVLALEQCPSARAWAERTGSTLYTSPRATRDLNDKHVLFEMLDELGLPRVAGEWSSPEASTFAELAARYGTPLVVQLSFGRGGSGTVFVHTEAEWRRACAKLAGEPLWIAPHVGALSLNINAIAIAGASVAGFPSVQLTGFEFLNAANGTYCGNDYAAAARLPRVLLDDVREQTERIGNRIAAWGYQGLYGLDFVVDERSGAPLAIDLNPRGQGSTPLHTQAERSASRTPLAAVALLLEAGVLSAEEAAGASSEFADEFSGALVRLRSDIDGLQMDDPPRPGVYSMDGVWRRPGLMLEELNVNEALLTGGPPRPGTRLELQTQVFRIYTRAGVLEPSSFHPAAWIKDLVRAVFPSRANRLRFESQQPC